MNIVVLLIILGISQIAPIKHFRNGKSKYLKRSKSSSSSSSSSSSNNNYTKKSRGKNIVEHNNSKPRVTERVEDNSSDSEIGSINIDDSIEFGTFEEAQQLIAEAALPEELLRTHITSEEELGEEIHKIHLLYLDKLSERSKLKQGTEEDEAALKRLNKMYASMSKKYKEIMRRRKVAKNF